MPIVDYTHDPQTGLYTFRDDAGSERAAFGDEAKGLADYVDQFRPPPPVPDERMAANAGGLLGGVIGDGAMHGAGDWNRNRPDLTRPAPPPQAVTDVPSGPGVAQAAPPSPSQVARGIGQMEQPPSVVNPLMTQEGRMEFLLRPKWVGGQAAFDPTAEAARRRPVPVSRSETIQGAIAETPEERQRRLDDEAQRRAAQQASMENVQAANEAQVAAHEEAKWQSQIGALDAQEELKRRQDRVRAVEDQGRRGLAMLETDRSNVRSMKVDSKRLFRTKSGDVNPVSVIGSAIAQAMGAFGAAMTGSKNFAGEIIENAIERDIALQERDIERQGAAADNALARFMRTYDMDLGEAREAVRMAQRDYASAQAQSLAASIGSADAQARGATLVADMLTKNQLTEAQFREMYGGRRVQATQYQMMSPRAAVAPHKVIDFKGNAAELDAITKALGLGTKSSEELNQSKFNLERRVSLPDGSFAWATTGDRATKAQKVLDAARQLRRNIARQKAILDRAGDSMDPELRAQYSTLVAANTNIEKELLDLGAITEADKGLVAPFTGEGGQDITALNSAVTASMDTTLQFIDSLAENQMMQLFQDPEAQVHLAPTEQEIGIEEQH